MKNKITLKLTPDSSFLLGGVSKNPAYDAVTALEKNSRLPYLTATALKGALRLDFEAFIGGTGEVTLCEPDLESQGCGTCLSCRLFGGSDRTEEGKLRFRAAHLENGERVLKKAIREEILQKGRRDGVAISRTLGKSRGKSYYTTQTFPHLRDTRDIVFGTQIDILRVLNDEERRYLTAFLAFLERTGIFMGSRKSVGLGHFKVSWELENSHEKPAAAIETEKTSKQDLQVFRLVLENVEPLVLGGLKSQYIINTMPYIPACTIGGAIGFGLSRHGIPDGKIRALFLEKRSISPFNVYYLESTAAGNREEPAQDYSFPIPTSIRRKKGETEEKDILLGDFIVETAIKNGKFEAIQSLFNALYRSNLRPVARCRQPDTTYNTKLAMDRNLQKARDRMLYNLELIEKQCRFGGFLIAESWIGDVLQNMAELLVGGRRSKGFGLTRIEKVEIVDHGLLLNPDVSIDALLRKTAGDYGIDMPQDRCFFILDILGDFPVAPGKSIQAVLVEELFAGLGMKIERAFPQVVWHGGYDMMNGKQKPLSQKIEAGSSFLVSVANGQEQNLREKVAGLVQESTAYEWDQTPLFVLNHPQHGEIWRES